MTESSSIPVFSRHMRYRHHKHFLLAAELRNSWCCFDIFTHFKLFTSSQVINIPSYVCTYNKHI